MSKRNRAFILGACTVVAISLICYAATVAQMMKDGIPASNAALTAGAGQIMVGNGTNYVEVTPAGQGDVASVSAAGAIVNGKINGASVPAAGALTTGNTLQVNGASSLTYAPINLAGGVNYVTGALPLANWPSITNHAAIVGTGAAGAPTILAVGTNNQLLHGNTAADPSWAALAQADFPSITNHALIVGTGAAGAPTTLGVGSTLQLLHGNTTADPSWSALAQADLPSITNHALIVGTGAAGAPTTLGVGATLQLLHGNTTADPSWSALAQADFPSITNHALIVGTGAAGAPTTLAVGGAGQLLKGNASADPSWAVPTTFSARTSDPAPTTAAMNLTLYDCDTSGGAFTVTLPANSSVGAGVIVWIRLGKIGTTTNILTIAPNSADGINSMGLNYPCYLSWVGECVCLMSSGVAGGAVGDISKGWLVLSYSGAPCMDNLAYNPHGIVAQRSDASSNTTATYKYGTTDRWQSAVTGTSITHTQVQDTNPNGTFSAFSQSNYAIKQTVTATTATVNFRQYIEARDAQQLQNKAAVFTCRVVHNYGSAKNFQLNLYPQATADSGTVGTVLTGGAIGVNISVADSTPTTLTSAPIKMGANMVNGCVLEIVMSSATTTTSKLIEFGDVWMQPGTVMLQPKERTYFEELTRCQRYFEKSYEDATAPGSNTATGANYSLWPAVGNNQTIVSVVCRTPKRSGSTPTVAYWDTAGNASKITEYLTGTGTTNIAPSTGTGGISANGFYMQNARTNLNGLAFHWTMDSDF